MAIKEGSTTTLIVDQEMMDAMIIALQDSFEACHSRLLWVEARKEEGDLDSGDKIQLEEVEALAQYQLECIPKILAEIKETYPHLEESEKKKSEIVIAKPSWNIKKISNMPS